MTVSVGMIDGVRIWLRKQLNDGNLSDGDAIDLTRFEFTVAERTSVLDELNGYVGAANPPAIADRYQLVWYKSHDKLVVYTPPYDERQHYTS